MITAVIRGGLGNQLFQYASAYALSCRLHQPLRLDTSFFPQQNLRGYKLDKLKLAEHLETDGCKDGFFEKIYKNRKANGLIRRINAIKMLPIKKGKYLIDHAGSFTESFFSIDKGNIFLNGYFQSEEYFQDYREDLLKQIVPVYEQDKVYKEFLAEIQKVSSVAVHIRRGDFVKGDGFAYHYILEREYYLKAIQIIISKIETPVFYCFSDDIEWVKENIGSSGTFKFISLTTPNADIDEMMLMKNCKHIITANSTFSWWAAWLIENSNAIRIVPDKAYGNNHMIPRGWLRIEV